MKKNIAFLIIGLFCYSFLHSSPVHPEGFIENNGVLNNTESATILYFASFENYRVFLKKDRLIYVIERENDGQKTTFRGDMVFPGKPEEIFPREPSRSQLNYIYKGKLSSPGIFNKIIYKNIKPGISLEFFFNKEGIKYNVVYEHAENPDMENLWLKYTGFSDIQKINSNHILLSTPLGDLLESVPYSYGLENEEEHILCSNYEVEGERVGLRFTNPGKSNFDKSVIDPWTTYLGGSDIEDPRSVFCDEKGNTYVTGSTRSIDFPASAGVFQDSLENGYDGFVTRFDSTGNLIWSTYYGGSGDDYPQFIKQDGNGDLILTGYTTSGDLMVSSGGQDSLAGSYDGFILKLDTAGNYQWAKYFGGSGGEFILDASIDGNNNIILGGYTSSLSLPGTSGAWQGSNAGALDIFISKLTTTGQLQWTTFYGGSNTEDVHGMATDTSGNIYLCGETYSTDFPVSAGAYQSYNAGQLDVFLLKFDSTGNRLWGTYFGGSSDEDANAIALTNAGDIFLSGYSSSIDFPILGNNPYQSNLSAGKDVVMIKFKPNGTPFRSTYFGGSNSDESTSLSVISDSLLWVSGNTHSNNLPMIGNSLQSTYKGASEGFMIKMDSSLTPRYSSYIGGSGNDYVFASSVAGHILSLSGQTYSTDFPLTTTPYQSSYKGNGDGFVAFFDTLVDPVVVSEVEKPQVYISKTLRVFPNPAGDYINISSDDLFTGAKTLLIINSKGKVVRINKVFRQGSKSFRAQVSDLKSGAYTVKLIGEQSSCFSGKFIKSP